MAAAAKSEIRKGDKLGETRRTSLGDKPAVAAKSEVMKGDKLGKQGGSGSQFPQSGTNPLRSKNPSGEKEITPESTPNSSGSRSFLFWRSIPGAKSPSIQTYTDMAWETKGGKGRQRETKGDKTKSRHAMGDKGRQKETKQSHLSPASRHAMRDKGR